MTKEIVNIQMVDLQGQYQKIQTEINASFQTILSTSRYINGPCVHSFAKNLANYLDCKAVIPCGNGTDALQIALMALDLQPGDEVITTPFTFVATAEVIALLQLKPVFVDVHPDLFTINEQQIEAVITPRTKAIIPVHLFGQAANMEVIMDIANKYNLFVIEDNAQAIGADFITKDGNKQKLGTIGHIGCTSFFPSKNLGCYGDGGAIFTNDEKLAAKIKMIANHGSSVRYHHDEVGVNSRLDSFQAAVLNAKLKYLNDYNKARQKAAQFYNQLLTEQPQVSIPVEASYSTHVYHQYTLLIDGDRDAVVNHLKAAGIPSGVYYPIPLHLQQAYQKTSHYKTGDFPIAEALSKKVLSLPMHTELTEDIQTYIIEHLIQAL